MQLHVQCTCTCTCMFNNVQFIDTVHMPICIHLLKLRKGSVPLVTSLLKMLSIIHLHGNLSFWLRVKLISYSLLHSKCEQTQCNIHMYTTVPYINSSSSISQGKPLPVHAHVHDSSRLSLIWMGLYVCVDNSRTVLEHHRPFHSYLCW